MSDKSTITKKKITDKQAAINSSIEKAVAALRNDQSDEGYWCYELEADCTIPAEYILMMHFMDEIDETLQEKMAVYLRRNQLDDGGWPLFYGSPIDISCSVKAYYALKLAGDNPDSPHMVKARQAILSEGGAAKSNVFTRIMLAMFNQVPWRAVPFLPVEIMLFPRWFPFHIMKVSYWSRTVMIPLFILCSYKAKAKNPTNTNVEELFVTPAHEEKNYFSFSSTLNRAVYLIERVGSKMERFIPDKLRKHATKKAEEWFTERLNGLSGLGAIFPAMVNAYEALDLLGYSEDHPDRITAKKAIQKLVVDRGDEAYCQPCVSPVWDSLLATCALHETGEDHAFEAIEKSADWLIKKQLYDEPGDWKEYNPELQGGGWPFQFQNDYYPDLDDTAFAAYALQNINPDKYKENIYRAANWLKGMQSRNGGFAAFDTDNTYYYLNEIPFADHGALLDPPTVDVTARCVMLFGLLIRDYPEFKEPMEQAIDYITSEQEEDGSWFGRWGTNYIYGTWSVLAAFETARIPKEDPRVQKAVSWLKNNQRKDGGWGEDNWSYHDPSTKGQAKRSNSFQTAWALLGLMAAGEADSKEVNNGISYLLSTQAPDGFWDDPEFTAPGFPRVFYLKYYGYSNYFPLWALSRYRNEIRKSGMV